MRIIKIILDGFKSYSGRVVLEDLDAQFNAITGLNGSGKSNILDGIIFVLGLGTMALVIISPKKPKGACDKPKRVDLQKR
jgi:structural maintenance of chromosome 2